MPHVRANGIALEYARSGALGGAPLLMIHGVGAQLIRWPQELIERLGAAGFDTIARWEARLIPWTT